MKRLRFTILIITCASVTLFPMISGLHYLFSKYAIEHEMLEKLEEGSLETLTLKEGSFHWYKKGKEIMVNGRLFDVKRIKKQEDKILITGLYDEKEDELNLTLLKLLDTRKQSSKQQVIIKILTQQLFIQEFVVRSATQYSFRASRFQPFEEKLVKLSMPTLDHPPRLV